MIKVLLAGAAGAMGRVITELIAADPEMAIVAGYDISPVEADYPVYDDLKKCEKADVIIDFSHYSAFDAILDYAVETKTPLIEATTGLSETQLENLKKATAVIPVFKTANMSVGINVLAKALKTLAADLGGFDIEIIEKHHNKKADAPSGTALLLANAVNSGLSEEKNYIYGREGRSCKRTPDQIGIHAIRGGTIPGEHTVLFAGIDEIVEIKHTALSKKVFASGAIKAAAFLIEQPAGLYDMQDVIR